MSTTLAQDVSILADLLAASIEPVLKPHGLSIRAFDLLAAIQASGGRETQAQISDRLEIRPSSLTESVQGAIRRGLVSQVAGADRRTKLLALTASGRKVLGDCLKAFEAAESRAMQGIGENQLSQAQKVVNRAIKNLQ